MEIHQFLPTLDPGDAIGNYTLKINNMLKEMGFESEIYVQDCHPSMSKFCRNYKTFKKRNNEAILLHHFAIGCDLNEFVNQLPNRKILVYHNITPPEFFKGYNDTAAYLCEIGRKQLKNFKNNIIYIIADSEYNEKELKNYYGFKNCKTAVVPPILNLSKFHKYINKISTEKGLNLSKGRDVSLIFVGRIAPNKKQEDLIKIFYYYSKYVNPSSRLILIGGYAAFERYYEYLVDLTKRLNVKDNVIFTGKVGDLELVRYYLTSDIFLCMSEHEGFCVPLVEAMFFQAPIIAYKSTAIPYTLGDAGILVKKKDYIAIAEMINLIIEDENLRKKIIRKQNERLKDFDPKKVERKFKDIIERVVSEV